MDWCRDVDWGTAPQWVSAGAALLAVVLSGVGVWIATRTFRKSNRDAHVSQARRIYAVHQSKKVTKSGVANVREGFAEPGTIGYATARGGFSTLDHVEVVKVTVHNNSDEIVSNVAIVVSTESVDWYPDNAGYVIAAVSPGTRYVVDFVTVDQSADGQIAQGMEFHVQMTFTDSVGNHWTRTDARPVEEIDDNPFRAGLGPGLITLHRGDPFSI